jgi:hypothetical protein
MSSTTYNNFLKAFPNADANIQVANINSYLKNKELQTYTPLSLNNVVENVKASNNNITVTKNFDIILTLGGAGIVSEDSLLQIGDILYIGGNFSVAYKGVTHKNFISFNRVTGEINGFNGLGNAYLLSNGGIVEHNGSIYVLFINLINIDNMTISTLCKITNNVPTVIEIPDGLYIRKMAFDKNGKFYICGTVGADYASTIYEYAENSTWTSITSSIPGFKCRGFAFDTNNVLYAVCNSSDKKCLYRKALDSNQWTALVDGEIVVQETGLSQPNISINQYNELYIYGDFTSIIVNDVYRAVEKLSRYNYSDNVFELLDIYSSPNGITSVVFDKNGDIYLDGYEFVSKSVAPFEFTFLDINYSNFYENTTLSMGYSMLLNNEELLVPYIRYDRLNNRISDLVSYKFNAKKIVVTDKKLQYTTKTEQSFKTTNTTDNTGYIYSLYNTTKDTLIIGCYDNEFSNLIEINLPVNDIQYISKTLDNYIDPAWASYPIVYIGGYRSNNDDNASDIIYIIGSSLIVSTPNIISELIIIEFTSNGIDDKKYNSPDKKFISKVQLTSKKIYINALRYFLNEVITDSSVYELSKETNTWINISSSIKDFISYSICLDKNDNLYSIGSNGLFLKNKDNDEWETLFSGSIDLSNNPTDITFGDLVIDNNGELYFYGYFIKIGESDIAYIARYNKTLKVFESVGNSLTTPVNSIVFDSQNNIYIAQEGEINIKTLVNNVWEYVNIVKKSEEWYVGGTMNIFDDVLTASYAIQTRGSETVISYDLKNKKTTYPGWKTTKTVETGIALEFNELGQNVEIFTDSADPFTNAVILNKSEGVVLMDYYENLPKGTQSKSVKAIKSVKAVKPLTASKDVKSKKGPFASLNVKSIFGRHL